MPRVGKITGLIRNVCVNVAAPENGRSRSVAGEGLCCGDVRQAHRETKQTRVVCWLVGCLTSQQHASVFQGRICSHNFTCGHTEIEVTD